MDEAGYFEHYFEHSSPVITSFAASREMSTFQRQPVQVGLSVRVNWPKAHVPTVLV